jgi:hypothetical protein
MSGAAESQEDFCVSEDGDDNNPYTEDEWDMGVEEELDIGIDEVYQHHQLLSHLHRDASFHKSQKKTVAACSQNSWERRL